MHIICAPISTFTMHKFYCISIEFFFTIDDLTRLTTFTVNELTSLAQSKLYLILLFGHRIGVLQTSSSHHQFLEASGASLLNNTSHLIAHVSKLTILH